MEEETQESQGSARRRDSDAERPNRQGEQAPEARPRACASALVLAGGYVDDPELPRKDREEDPGQPTGEAVAARHRRKPGTGETDQVRHVRTTHAREPIA